MNILWHYRRLFRPYARSLVLGVLMLVVTRALATSIPWLIKTSVSTLEALSKHLNNPEFHLRLAQEQAELTQYLLWILGIATLMLVSRIASRQYLLSAGKRIEFDLRNRLYKKLLGMPPAFFQAHPTGELMSRITSDVEATRFIPGGGVMLGVNTLLAYCFTLPMMWRISPQLTLVAFLIYPLLIFLMTRLSGRVKEGFHAVQEDLADISTMSQESLNGMAVIQAYAKERSEAQRFEALCDAYLGSYRVLVKERLLLFILLAVLSGFSFLMVLWLGGWQIIDKQLDLGGFVAFTLYLEMLAWPTMALGWTISVFQQGTAALERIDQILSIPEPEQGSVSLENQVQADAVQGKIEVRSLTFRYHNTFSTPRESNMPVPEAVLQDISFTVQPGETIAIVGPVGAGKSTLLRLLPRLYDVPDGSIFLDGQDINQIPLEQLRQAMVFMPQLSFLFSTAVSQNIAFGRPETAQSLAEHIIPVARAAEVHEDVMGFPEQYGTLVGERGIMLSGGQRQRVALARAILMEAPILILDDPFSNIDAETERNIIAALEARAVFHDKTTLFATHRFSLVRQADRVVLLDTGKLVAVGTHAELLATQPLYQKLNRLEALRHEFDKSLESGEDTQSNQHQTWGGTP